MNEMEIIAGYALVLMTDLKIKNSFLSEGLCLRVPEWS